MNRKLDTAIAELLGIDINHAGEYSTCGNSMLELDREMRERGYRLYLLGENLDGEPNFTALYIKGKTTPWDRFTVAETEPLARAKAAYKALTGKEWQDEQ